MTSTIDTTNGQPYDQHVTATYESPEDVLAWVERWTENLKAALGCGFYLDGVSVLCTSWPVAAAPGTHTKCTERHLGESDENFLDRHGEQVLDEMSANQPNP